VLSISPAISASHGGYFSSLANGNYYTEGGEPPGRWLGAGASLLGLTGEVDSQVFHRLLQGYSPDGKSSLVQNAGDPARQAAWDLTPSAPKTFSVLWSQADPELRQILEEIHALAVEKAFHYLEMEAAHTRRGHGGRDIERTKWVAALFQHGTSRAKDPQLHTHIVLINLAVRDDGTTGTLLSLPFFRHKMAAGAVYRAELAALLQSRLGLSIERVKTWFEIEGVSKDLVAEFSKRRAQIEEALASRGLSGAIASKEATLRTRAAKEHLPREVLFELWQATGRAFGWSRDEVKALLNRRTSQSRTFAQQELRDEVLNILTHHQSFFTKRDLVRRLAESAQGRGYDAAAVQLFAERIVNSSEVTALPRHRGEAQFTTQNMLLLEEKLLKLAGTRKRSNAHTLPSHHSAQFSKLSHEQRQALDHITASPGDLKIVSGLAGTGKSTLLREARLLWQKAGYSVWGASLTGKAARGLEQTSGIPSVTTASLELALQKNVSPFRDDPRPLDSKTILVIDEAGMLGTRHMAVIVEAAVNAGAKLILVGDAKQLQPITAGGPFRALGETLGEAKLTSIVRQREEWAREVVKKFAFGSSASALHDLQSRGLVSVSPTWEETISKLLSDWKEAGVRHPERNLILANQNETVRLLNRGAKRLRLESGELGASFANISGEIIHENDRVLFTRNSRLHGVSNGSLGTLINVEGSRLTVMLDNGATTRFSLSDYDHVRLGYAVTTHKAQGMTAQNVFVLAGDAMQDREISYVQASRARGETRLYLDKESAGEHLETISRQMRVSHQKILAHELLEEERLPSREYPLCA
jgi:conjugative relaxase-like TrwC/TraI family protein